MSKYANIIEMLEAATEPSRELDFWITIRCDEDNQYTDQQLQDDIDIVGIDQMWVDAAYTASLDAAIGLVERMLPGAWLVMSRAETGWYVNIDGIIGGDTRPHGTAKSPTLALALLTAMFRAIEAQEGQP